MKYILLLLLVLLIPSTLAAAGDVLYENYGNGTASTEWLLTGGTAGYITYPGDSSLEIASTSRNAWSLNNTGAHIGKVLNLTVTRYSSDTSFADGESWYFGLSNTTVNPTSNTFVSFSVGGCNLYQTSMSYAETGACPLPLTGLTTSNTTLTIWWNTSATTSNVRFYVNGVNLANTSEAVTGTNAIIFFYYGNAIGSAIKHWNMTLCEEYCGTPASPGSIPIIDNSTFNHSTAINASYEIVWRTNRTSPSRTEDTTPTIRFDTDVDAWCRISNTSQNWSQMGNSRNCATTNATSHVCSVIAGDAYGVSSGLNSAYISCAYQDDVSYETETGVSTSGPLQLYIGPDVNQATKCSAIVGDILFYANVSKGRYNPKTKTYNESFITPVNSSNCGYTYVLNNTGSITVNYTFSTNYSQVDNNLTMYVDNVLINKSANKSYSVAASSVTYVNWSINLTNYPVLQGNPNIFINVSGVFE